MKTVFFFICAFLLYSCSRNPGGTNIKASMHDLGKYRIELDSLRKKTSKPIGLPHVKFFQFGMGNRTKILYKEGVLTNALSGDTLKKWKIKTEIIVPANYLVYLITTDNKKITIKEDTTGVWVYSKWKDEVIPGTESKIRLPEFEDCRYPRIMKVLHHEILINIVNSKPLPNFYVYSEPLRREASMMAMCLNYTNNLHLIKTWVQDLDTPYDKNRQDAGNLGQTLYLISLYSKKNTSLINKTLEEAVKRENKISSVKFIDGQTDSIYTPVYANKWLKFGLKSLTMKDEYSIPFVEDSYSALVWWAFRSYYKTGTKDTCNKSNQPYFGWACDHFHGDINSPVSNYDYPLTWEKDIKSVNYTPLKKLDNALVEAHIASPNSWHAAEMFLYLLELKRIKYQMSNKYL